jgi:hypothetical protein
MTRSGEEHLDFAANGTRPPTAHPLAKHELCQTVRGAGFVHSFEKPHDFSDFSSHPALFGLPG